MGVLMKLKFRVGTFICNTFFVGTHFFGIKRYLYRFAGITVGPGTKIVGPIKISSECKLYIGDECWIGYSLTVYGNGSVRIGDNNDFGPDIVFLTGSHKIGGTQRRAGSGLTYDFEVGNSNWVGAKVVFINGIHAGNANVFGAMSLINKDCDDDSVYVGVPGKKIRGL